MAENPRRQVKITCPACSQHLDVTELPPFEIVACPSCGEKLLVPLQLGNYRLLTTIGGGGMGMVYKAVDLSLGRQVAVKLLRKDLAEDKHFVESFTREARAVAALNHPNIAMLYFFGVENGQHYLAMELVQSGSLDDMIMKRKRIPEAEVLNIAIQVASGLQHAYQRGLIHRDIKPGNILFNDGGNPKIIDFGLAEFHTDQVTKKPQQEGIWGTPYYIAPEKVAGEKEDFRSDIYSLGGTLFHALAGRAPFEANTATDVVLKHMTTPALSLKTFAPDITDNTARVVGRMLAKNRANRHSSYDTVIHDLQLAKQNLQTKGVHRVSTDVKAKVEQNMVKTTLLIGAVVVGIAVCVYFLWAQRKQIFGSSGGYQEMIASTTNAPAITTNVPSSTATQTGVLVWKPLWDNAVSSLNQGAYPAAIAQYQDAMKKMDPTDPMLAWGQAQIGLCHLLSFKTNDAVQAYGGLIPTDAPLPSPDAAGRPGQLPVLIALVMTDRAPAKGLLDQLDGVPGWAQALIRFHLGIRCLSREEFTAAHKLLTDYTTTSPSDDPRWEWTMKCENRANILSLECETFSRDFPSVLELQKQGNYESALAKLESIRTSVTYPTLVTRVEGVEAALKQELAAATAEKLRADEARLGAIFQADKQFLEKIDTTVPAHVANYVFAPLANAYKAALEKMHSEKGKEEAAQKLARYQGLAGLKAFTVAEINRKPYKGGVISTRTGGEVKGTLYKADDDKLYFKIAYGDIPQLWRNIPPVEVAKIFRGCIANVADAEKKAKLETALAAFKEELKVK